MTKDGQGRIYCRLFSKTPKGKVKAPAVEVLKKRAKVSVGNFAVRKMAAVPTISLNVTKAIFCIRVTDGISSSAANGAANVSGFLCRFSIRCLLV